MNLQRGREIIFFDSTSPWIFWILFCLWLEFLAGTGCNSGFLVSWRGKVYLVRWLCRSAAVTWLTAAIAWLTLINSNSAVYLPCKLSLVRGVITSEPRTLKCELGIYPTETFALAQRQMGRSKSSKIWALNYTVQCKAVKISERCFTCDWRTVLKGSSTAWGWTVWYR